ncbi:Glutathione transport system permease protein GsiC [Xylophilus ampelinus]|nr:ABC transporter permease [Variovorax sp.]VTY27806.1 Glutathione transport system permease protein GsiC [Xylophilus ampelinus]
MYRLVLARLLSAIPVLLLVSLLTLSLVWLVPGDAAVEMAGASATQDEVARIRTQMGLDKPLATQAVDWYVNLLHGDLGQSLLLNRSVTQAIVERLPVTGSLTLLAFVITVVAGLASGVLAAVKRNTWIDQGVMTLSLLGLSLPDFWLGLVGIYVFAVTLGWFPTGGYVPFTVSPLGWLHSLFLPALALAATQMGVLARMTRSSMLEVLSQDYIRTARAKGLPMRIVVGKHAMANIAIPTLTVVGINVGILVGGAVIVESVFSIPGVGRLVIGAIQRRDIPVIQGGLLMIACAMVLINLVVDLLYAAFDPRVRRAR